MSDLQTSYGVNALETLGMSWRDVLTSEREKAQRDLARAVTGVLHTQWRSTLPTLSISFVNRSGRMVRMMGHGSQSKRTTGKHSHLFIDLNRSRPLVA